MSWTENPGLLGWVQDVWAAQVSGLGWQLARPECRMLGGQPVTREGQAIPGPSPKDPGDIEDEQRAGPPEYWAPSG